MGCAERGGSSGSSAVDLLCFRAINSTSIHWLVQSGKIIDRPGWMRGLFRFLHRLRRSSVRGTAVPAALDWSGWMCKTSNHRGITGPYGCDVTSGFLKAIEMCNNNGHCRNSTQAHVPSYRVTRDEQHLTRGRATLAIAVFRTAGRACSGSQAVLIVWICLSDAKGATECPTGVDMHA